MSAPRSNCRCPPDSLISRVLSRKTGVHLFASRAPASGKHGGARPDSRRTAIFGRDRNPKTSCSRPEHARRRRTVDLPTIEPYASGQTWMLSCLERPACLAGLCRASRRRPTVGDVSLRHPVNSLRPLPMRGDMDQTALDLPAASKRLASCKGLLAGQSALTLALFFSQRLLPTPLAQTRSIFGCQAPGYSADRYLAYCGGANYADFEHYL